MTSDREPESEVLRRAGAGDPAALAAAFSEHRPRLRRMVQLRLDRRLQGRVDPSDVLQEAYLEVARSLADYLNDPRIPFYLWVRFVTGRKLQAVHRHHLGVQARDAGREMSLHRGALPQASSVSLAEQLLGRYSSPSQAAVTAELRAHVQDALNGMDPIDREVLALRSFEELSNAETAQVLGIGSRLGTTTASAHGCGRWRPGRRLPRTRSSRWPAPRGSGSALTETSSRSARAASTTPSAPRPGSCYGRSGASRRSGLRARLSTPWTGTRWRW
ncbi:MAG TPA: sigma-70 family RNA polymerase sigma factor [Gemmataceae bacterium]|nr:sigma-70 family RNA polymerase sigma factor [Gemmataceae bacterium]